MGMLLAVLPGALCLGAEGRAFWAEGEEYSDQHGSVRPDRPPFSARGGCLGSNWGARADHYVRYRFSLPVDVPGAVLWIRYARMPSPEGRFRVELDGRIPAERLLLPPTGGWGHRRDDEWRYKAVPVGDLRRGAHVLKIKSLAHRNNTNIDGFFVASPDFTPPNERPRIEKFPRLAVRTWPGLETRRFVDEDLSMEDFNPELDDWYYPREEADDMRRVEFPELVKLGKGSAVLRDGQGKETKLKVGESAGEWRLAAVLEGGESCAVIERDFARWGIIAYIGSNGLTASVRKAVGRQESLAEPRVKYPGKYFETVLASLEDVLGRKVLQRGEDASYEDVAGFLAPLKTYTFVAMPQWKEKLIVDERGVVRRTPDKSAPTKDTRPASFDPVAMFPDVSPTCLKAGVLGGWLPAVDLACRDKEAGSGYELIVVPCTGDETKAHVRLRAGEGARYFEVGPDGHAELEMAGPFYRAVLELKSKWERAFAPAMKMDLPERRVADAARACIAKALAGCVGPHPKYGMGVYWGDRHDGFPPTTISMNRCLIEWGLFGEAKERLGYYLENFIREDGTFNYYGPAVSEYGQLLQVAAMYVRRAKDTAWLRRHLDPLNRAADHLLARRREAVANSPKDSIAHGLIRGAAEADTHKDVNYYFSGDAWAWRGFVEFGRLLSEVGSSEKDEALSCRGKMFLEEAERYRADILASVKKSVVRDAQPPFLPPIAGFDKPFERMTQDRLASYTNYRYWLEFLSAGLLDDELSDMIINYRVRRGGELLATTRFSGHMDDWPYAEYAWAILARDRVEHYLLGYYAHMAHHMTRGTFTAYEQVPISGLYSRAHQADYCVPAQLVTPLMTKWMLVFEEPDADRLWLCKAVPRRWFGKGFKVSGAPTRWGRVSFEVKPGEDGLHVSMDFDGEPPPCVVLRCRPPHRKAIKSVTVNGKPHEDYDAAREIITLKPRDRSVEALVSY